MPKRKRSEPEDGAGEQSESREERKIALQTMRLTNKFDHDVEVLFRALKTARGFERQKMGRRQKTAKKENDEKALARIEAEVQVLKTLDLAMTAGRYLFKQLAKTKRIAETPAFVKFKEAKSLSIEGPKDNAEANVIARLFKSNPIKNVMPGILDGMRGLLGVDAAPALKPTKDLKETSGGGNAEDKATRSKGDDRRQDEEDELSRVESGSGDVSMDDAQSDDFAQFGSRLAPSSGESDSEAEEDGFSGPKQGRYDRAADLSLSPTPSDSLSESPSATTAKGSKTAAVPKAPVKDTSFLPSLMMGGYWSGSESGSEEPAPDERPVRKNRMGQQARRALWEKKYGSRANHVQKEQQKKKNSRDSGWDMRRGATDGDGDGRGKFSKGRNGVVAGKPQRKDEKGRTGSNNEPLGQRKKAQDDKPLHPSWEAKRRAKEQAAQVSFQGKKIVFD